MLRSWVSRAEPWAMAATPPTTMNSIPARLRAGRSCSKSTMEGLPPGPPHLFGKALEPHQVAQALLDGQLEVLPEEGPVDVLLVGLNDGIRLDDEPWRFVHEATLPDSGHRAATRLAPIGSKSASGGLKPGPTGSTAASAGSKP